ncbi:PucR family transcriptional regulator [Aeromicrobium endophyticum]|uniref:PucR family transcriptional regulator n=1 Tax=Aeromicrobium endophyticum TaxID=2292704 RepID=A0A371P4W0_9ACTN|nr:helix-turn-helix domain-containing protein [Aeromicrobium endophyticum]REK70962.1 PucR family transcriptional regulator [Aeromicrobium endophyticum]
MTGLRLHDDAAHDLFAVADAISAIMDAPVTIEDRESRVVAFSVRQEEADGPRVESILGRRVPPHITQRFVDDGVFRRLHGSDRPIFVPTGDTGADCSELSRVAVAVRAGDEILGSVWVAVRDEPSADRMEALREASGPVALAMLRARTGTVAERARRSELVATAVSGSSAAGGALAELGLAGLPVAVLELAVRDERDEQDGGGVEGDLTGAERGATTGADRLAEQLRLSDAFALHLAATSPRAAVAVVGPVCLGLLPVAGEHREETAARVASRFVDRIGSGSFVVGIGAPASDVRQLARSREDAARASRVLRSRRATRRVGRLVDLQADAFMTELSDAIVQRGEALAGPAARLEEHDRAHGTRLVETFSAWLDHFGDITAASRSLFVHPNTFRYRLRTVAQVGGIDLGDSDTRFAAMLHFRLRTYVDDV